MVETVVVVGAEKSSDAIAGSRVEARSVALDADFESVHGATLPALAGLLMRRYMHEYGLGLGAFEGFSINAHANGKRNPYAMYRNSIREGAFTAAPMVADPVSLFDGAPDADGAAALVLTSTARARQQRQRVVRIVGSAVATDAFALQTREDLLFLNAASGSVNNALQQAGIDKDEIDLFELHDSFTILAVLSLEAAGYAARGEGWRMVDHVGRDGSLPISTFGGLKSRGNPVGATGVYQAVEATWQLRGESGENQVPDAEIAMIQNLGGIGSTAITHLLRRDS
jgi:acetyl-CoA C-acetyltransferase